MLQLCTCGTDAAKQQCEITRCRFDENVNLSLFVMNGALVSLVYIHEIWRDFRCGYTGHFYRGKSLLNSHQ